MKLSKSRILVPNLNLEILLHTVDILPVHQGAVGSLVVDELAGEWIGPVFVPVYGQGPSTSCNAEYWSSPSHSPVLPLTCTELRLLSAAQFLYLIVDVEIPGELLVILNPVASLFALPAVSGVALHPAVDDVDGGAKPGRQAISPVLWVVVVLKIFQPSITSS